MEEKLSRLQPTFIMSLKIYFQAGLNSESWVSVL